MHREAHGYHRAARAEIVRASEEARERADAVRAEAQAAVERARAEVHTLAARRDAITAQLGELSGVIEALAVHDGAATRRRAAETTDHDPHASPCTGVLMTQPEFPTVFRGYDPVQVDQHLTGLQEGLDAARQEAEAARREAAAASVELTKARQSAEDHLVREVDDHRQRMAALEEQGRKASNPTFADLGERIGTMLGLADEERRCRCGRRQALEADETRRAAKEEGLASWFVPRQTGTPKRSTTGPTPTWPPTCSPWAKAEADALIVAHHAAREAAARREEAEAYYEKQRAATASQAADFERTLGERREAAAAEFNGQMAKQDAALLPRACRSGPTSWPARPTRTATPRPRRASASSRPPAPRRPSWSAPPATRPSACAATPSASSPPPPPAATASPRS